MNMEDEMVQPAQSSSSKPFSSGVRVLSVDNDVTCLETIETMLRACKYEVVGVKHGNDALSILREKQGGFDIVLTDVHLPDMDGISLLDQIRNEFKLPVVMMSADDNEDVMRRCLQSGASFYYLKPPNMNDLKNLWQYVFLKKCADMTAIKQTSVPQASPPEKVIDEEENTSEEETECESSVNEINWREGSKRKRPEPEENNQDGDEEEKEEEEEEEEEDDEESANPKKARVIWHTALHNKFLEAIDIIGLDRSVPKKILKLMNVPGLTRENIASHLQKYRIYVRQLQQARQSAGPILARSSTSGDIASSFASSHPSVISNLEERFPRVPEQQPTLPEQQPTLSALQTRLDSMPQPTYGNSLQTSNQGRLNQPLLGTGSHNQPNNPSFSGFNMKPHNTRMGSSLCGDISTGLVSGMGATQMTNQQSLERTQHFSNGSIDHNNTLNLPGNDIQNVGSMGSFNNLQQVPNSNSTNNNYAGFQMNGTGQLVGMNQMAIGHGSPANGTNSSYNMIAEIFKRKMALEAAGKSHTIPEFTPLQTGYATQGIASSNGFTNENQFPTMLNNVIQQPPPVTQPILLQQQQNGIGVGEEGDSLFNFMRNNSTFGNASLPQSFGEGDLNDIFFRPVGQSSNQQQVCEQVMDPEFNISTYEADGHLPLL